MKVSYTGSAEKVLNVGPGSSDTSNTVVPAGLTTVASVMSPPHTQPMKNHQAYNLINGNHDMYIRRRRPDTLDVQQMKSQKRDDEERKAKEKELLNREMAAREEAEQLRLQMEKKYKDIEDKILKVLTSSQVSLLNRSWTS